MSGNITFTMIKPCAVRNNFIGPILKMITEKGFKILQGLNEMYLSLQYSPQHNSLENPIQKRKENPDLTF